MRILTATFIGFAAGCGPRPAPGPPARLVAGSSDTILVNRYSSTLLPVRALDPSGQTVVAAPIRYAWAGGDSLRVTPTGEITCSRAGDLTVRAAVGQAAGRFLIRCRPVRYVRIPGPLQFILGDAALSRPLAIPITAYDSVARPVALVAGTASIRDSDVAALRGLTLVPRSRGITLADASVGNGYGRVGVHIYQRVDTLAALDTLLRVLPRKRLFAVPLGLAPGEVRRQHLPPGEWMLTILPEEDDSAGVQLRVEGAECTAHLLNTPRRFGCLAKSGATVIIYRPFGGRDAPTTTSYLLVRWLFS